MELEANVSLAIVILLSALLTKWLHRFRKRLSILITNVLITESSQISQLELEIQKMKNESENISDFDQRVVLYAERTKKEAELNNINKRFEERISRTRTKCKIFIFLVIEASRVIIIILNRTSPVFIIPTNMSWPLTRILSYPTGVPGAISPVFWGLVCRQYFHHLLSLYPTNK